LAVAYETGLGRKDAEAGEGVPGSLDEMSRKWIFSVGADMVGKITDGGKTTRTVRV
jgi:hypothetical protein